MCTPSTGSRKVAASHDDVAQLHEFEHWPARWVWPLVALMVTLQLAAVYLPPAYWPALLAICPAIGAIMFVFTLAFHDASHGRFHPVERLNEFFGHIVGTMGFTPLNVYRYAHARHHAQLAREGDPELWPFNSPTVGRPARIAAAFFEIVLGVVYTPLLFLRSVLVGKLTQQERKLIIRGYLGCFAAWALVLAASAYLDMWYGLVVATLIPLTISGVLQTLNKYEQHMGLHGHTVLGLTRTVVDQSKATELVSAAMLYNDYHGTHHRYAKIPYYHLPNATPYALAGAREHCPVYPSIFAAFRSMLGCLGDPKAGPQWVTATEQASMSDSSVVSVSIKQPVFTGNYDVEGKTPAAPAGSPKNDSPNRMLPHRRVG